MTAMWLVEMMGQSWARMLVLKNEEKSRESSMGSEKDFEKAL
jgi:hypothetical protein